eukprot:GEMP01097979.1.p1 GENE.GEMP01097979.1~~GEMP01097979.1.p1  ORF type:complete len:241 (+),score=42.68 GEMP01097979.1:51-773(+)
MAPVELITPEGYRLDGRLVAEHREIDIEFGSRVAGQATFQLGNSIAKVTVHGPREAKRNKQKADTGVICVDYHIASFANAGDRRKQAKDRSSVEIGSWLEQVFSQIVLVNAYPRSQIDISVLILANDGAHVACAVNATTLALVDAGVEMRDLVAATTVGYVYQQPCIDLNRREEFGNPTALVCALASDVKKLVLVESESKMAIEKMQVLLSLAEIGCSAVVRELKSALLQRATDIFAIRS